VLIWKVRISGTAQKTSRVITNGAMKTYGANRWEYNRRVSRRRRPLSSGRSAPIGVDVCTSVEAALFWASSVAGGCISERAM